MKKLWDKIPKRVQRMDSTKPLMENNNDYDQLSETGQLSQELRSMCSDDTSDREQTSSHHTERGGDQRSEPLSFPEVPTDLGKHLDQHLEDVDEIVKNNHATDDFLCEILPHIDALLQNISTSKSWVILTNWVSQRKDQLDHSDLGLLDEWESKAEEKLLEMVKVEFRDSLGKILDADRTQMDRSEEAYTQLYVDVIQCTNAMPKLVQEKRLLSNKVKKVCFQELQSFVKRYNSAQGEILHKKAEAWRENPETIHFLKTLKTCKELRQHIQAEGNVKAGSVDETKKTLEKLEALTLELIKKIATELAESCLQDYFRSASRPRGKVLLCRPGERHCELFDSLRNHFPKMPYALDEQKIVMNEVYKVVAHSYFKHLLQNRQSVLKKQWSSDVGKAIQEDADELHATISDLAPGVQQWNRLLLVIQEVSDCKDLDSVKLTISLKQEDIEKRSEDPELVTKLLQWKGLSKGQISEVLDALPGSPPKPKSKPLYLRFCCC
ncbi:uncharacterized protein LOC103129101 isoform X2 [Poecilia formosa]|uniref:uncharacterized protein LOC103129101 isoform X2 n=1 Tax=Poecilia formosa TaxID=48698 RepID=UPI0007B91675|nr:PREDICTED: uncharacterized protein LOC103129101 isoform X2 [Poecilia formosa]